MEIKMAVSALKDAVSKNKGLLGKIKPLTLEFAKEMLSGTRSLSDQELMLGSIPLDVMTEEMFRGLVIKISIHDCNLTLLRSALNLFPERRTCITPDEWKTLISISAHFITQNPSATYEDWLGYVKGDNRRMGEGSRLYANLDNVPKQYQTQELLVVWVLKGFPLREEDDNIFTTELMDAILKADSNGIKKFPDRLKTKERLLWCLKQPEFVESEAGIPHESVDDEIAKELLSRHFYNIPSKYFTREVLLEQMPFISPHKYHGVNNVAQDKPWVLSKTFFKDVAKLKNVNALRVLKEYYRIKSAPFDDEAAVIAVPAFIIWVPKQTKKMADAVLKSPDFDSLAGHLSQKFITKKTAPLFVGVESHVKKVETVLHGPAPAVILPPEETMSLDVTEDELDNLRRSGYTWQQ